MKDVEIKLIMTIRAVIPTGMTAGDVVDVVQELLEEDESDSCQAQDGFIALLGDEVAEVIEDATFSTVRTDIEAL